MRQSEILRRNLKCMKGKHEVSVVYLLQVFVLYIYLATTIFVMLFLSLSNEFYNASSSLKVWKQRFKIYLEIKLRAFLIIV